MKFLPISSVHLIAMKILTLVFFSSIAQSVKKIDLNRTPSPEPEIPKTDSSKGSESGTHINQTKANLPNSSSLVWHRETPGTKALKLAKQSGHAINSKEYKRIYRSNYRQFRKEEGVKFYEGKSDNPSLRFEEEKKKLKERAKIRYDARKERRKANQLTLADKKWYLGRQRQHKEYYQNNSSRLIEYQRQYREKENEKKKTSNT